MEASKSIKTISGHVHDPATHGVLLFFVKPHTRKRRKDRKKKKGEMDAVFRIFRWAAQAIWELLKKNLIFFSVILIESNARAYLACSLACASGLHTIEWVPKIQTRLWAACQRSRPELEAARRSAGHLEGERVAQTHLEVSRKVFFFFLFSRSVCVLLSVSPSSSYWTMVKSRLCLNATRTHEADFSTK